MGPTSTHRNRRQHPRAALESQVQFYCNNQLFMGRAVDISEGGVGLIGRFPRLRRGDQVKLFVALPCTPSRNKGKLYLLEGQVVWQEAAQIGVSFVDPPLDSLLDVRGYVKLAA